MVLLVCVELNNPILGISMLIPNPSLAQSPLLDWIAPYCIVLSVAFTTQDEIVVKKIGREIFTASSSSGMRKQSIVVIHLERGRGLGG